STDIRWQENDRLYGSRWTRFITSCRAGLGTGSGASILDADGSIEEKVLAYRRRNPRAGFASIHRAVLGEHEGNVRFEVISPRIFEAAALRTALVLFPAEYSGVLQPDLHYIR